MKKNLELVAVAVRTTMGRRRTRSETLSDLRSRLPRLQSCGIDNVDCKKKPGLPSSKFSERVQPSCSDQAVEENSKGDFLFLGESCSITMAPVADGILDVEKPASGIKGDDMESPPFNDDDEKIIVDLRLVSVPQPNVATETISEQWIPSGFNGNDPLLELVDECYEEYLSSQKEEAYLSVEVGMNLITNLDRAISSCADETNLDKNSSLLDLQPAVVQYDAQIAENGIMVNSMMVGSPPEEPRNMTSENYNHTSNDSDDDLLMLDTDPFLETNYVQCVALDDEGDNTLICQVKTMKSSCYQKLVDCLRKPYDENELKSLLESFKHRALIEYHRELRSGCKTYKSEMQGMSYEDYHQDLADQISSTTHKPLQLFLLRGFFFWLQNVGHGIMTPPWKDPSCMEIFSYESQKITVRTAENPCLPSLFNPT